MFFQRAKMSDNIVYIRFRKMFTKTKHFVDLLLYVQRRIFVIHQCYIEFFLITMINYCKFELIIVFNVKLIKSINDIDDKNVKVINYDNDNVIL